MVLEMLFTIFQLLDLFFLLSQVMKENEERRRRKNKNEDKKTI